MSDRLARGDLVLVTGATGLVGSTVADELLQRGFKVRGVTRNSSKEGLLLDKFDKAYGHGAFELVDVADPSQPGAYDSALEGVAGIVHAATDASFAPDYDKVVGAAVDITLGILQSALKVSTVKSVVVTSSRVAAYSPAYGHDVTVTLEDWNDAAVELAQKLPADSPLKSVLVYTASKTRAEQELWAFVKAQKPSFAVSTVLPEVITGPVVNPADRVYSTSTWTTELFNSKTDGYIVGFLNPPGFIVDVRDVAVIHIGALLASDVSSQRLWAATHQVTANQVLDIWRQAFPQRQFPANFDFPPAPKITIDNHKSTELVQRYAGRDYISAKQSLLDNVKHLA